MAYRKMLIRVHPDRNGGSKRATSACQRLNACWDTYESFVAAGSDTLGAFWIYDPQNRFHESNLEDVSVFP